MSVDVVVVNYHTPDDLEQFVESLEQHAPDLDTTLTIVEVDAGEDYLHRFTWGNGRPGRTIGIATNTGYARACNAGAHGCSGDTIALFNADVVLTEGAIDRCVAALWSEPKWGVLGPRQVDTTNRIRHAGIFGTHERPAHRGWNEIDRGQYRDVVEAVTVSGSAYFVKRYIWHELTCCELYQKVAPDAEGAFLPTQHYYEETWCIPEGMHVWTKEGPLPIEDVTPGIEVWGYHEPSGSIRSAPVAWAGRTGTKPILELVARGRTIRVTGDHVMLVAEDVPANGQGGNLRWKKADDTRVGDYLVAVTDLPEPDSELPSGVDTHLMLFLGQYAGNGSHDDRSINIALPLESPVRAFYEALAEQCFTKLTTWTRRGEPTVPRCEGTITIQDRPRAFRFSTVEGVQLLLTLGFGGTARTKRIPGWVFRAQRQDRMAFLAGIVDSDGSVGTNGQLSVTFANRALVEDVRQLLVSCGLPVSAVSVIPERRVKMPTGRWSTGAEAYSIVCTDPGSIPFLDPRYRERVQRRPKRGGRKLAQRLGLDPEAFAARRITEVRPQGEEPVYDITVPGLDSFVAEGVVVHNCSYHAAAHGYAVVYYGPTCITHKWHQASPLGGHADRQMATSRRLFRTACDVHGIAHD